MDCLWSINRWIFCVYFKDCILTFYVNFLYDNGYSLRHCATNWYWKAGAGDSQRFVYLYYKTWGNLGAFTVLAYSFLSKTALKHKPGLGIIRWSLCFTGKTGCFLKVFQNHICLAQQDIQFTCLKQMFNMYHCAPAFVLHCNSMPPTLSNSCLYHFMGYLQDETSPLLHEWKYTLSDSLIELRCWGALVLGVRRPIA